MKNFKLSFAVFLSAMIMSCSSDDDSTNPIDPIDPVITAPATYSFIRNEENTVSYSGQTTRIEMASQTASAIKNPSKSQAEIDAMFSHLEDANDFEEVPGLELNSSSKNVRSKTAASIDYFSDNTTVSNALKADFDGYIGAQVQEVFPFWDIVALPGFSGQLQENGGGSTRYINGKGLEYNQAFAKGLIGALITDQILNNYLSPSVLDAGDNIVNNDNDVLDEGKDYTTMEHKWDEAFGYLYGAEVDPQNNEPVLGVDDFLNKYLAKVEGDPSFAGIAGDIYDAFKLGRAAIVGKNYTLRDEQVSILREKISLIIAVRSVYYLQAGKTYIIDNNPAKAFHNLSEGYGFIFSLQFTRIPNTDSPYFDKPQVDGFIDQLMAGNGFWDLTPETLDQMSEQIAGEFGFTVEAAADDNN
jgi:hypothetical protein